MLGIGPCDVSSPGALHIVPVGHVGGDGGVGHKDVLVARVPGQHLCLLVRQAGELEQGAAGQGAADRPVVIQAVTVYSGV